MSSKAILLAALGLTLLASCGDGGQKVETFACPNGPDIAVLYEGDTAVIALPDGRRETLQRTEPGKEIYAKPGMVWQIESFRTGRLTDGQKSYGCDQSSV